MLLSTNQLPPWHPGMKYAGKTLEWLHAGPVGHVLVANKMLKEL